MSELVLFWSVLGIVLILAELVIPGGIVVFPGIAGLIIALSLYLGFINGWVQAFTWWFILSLALLLLFRGVAQKLFGGERTVGNTDENDDLSGQLVEVIETIGPGEQTGRVNFQDSSWTAMGDGSILKPGQRAKIVCRDNISLVVEKASLSDTLLY